MSKPIGEHLRCNVVGYIAIFLFAIGGTAYATHPSGADTISTEDLINGQVRTADIGTGSVRPADLQDDSVTGTEIADTDSLGPAEVGGLGGADISDDSLTGADVDEASFDPSVLQRRVRDACRDGQAIQAIDEDAAVTCAALGGPPSGAAGGDLADTYPNPTIAGDAVGSAEIAADSLAAADLAPDSVGSSEILFDSVGSAEITNFGIQNPDLATGAVNGVVLQDLSISSADIGSGAVSSTKLAGNAVGTANVGADALTGSDIDEVTLNGVNTLRDGADNLAAGALGEAAQSLTTATCNPDGSVIACANVGMNVPNSGEVLLIASGGWYGIGSGPDESLCAIRTTGAAPVNLASLELGQSASEHSTADRVDGFSMTALADVDAGTTNWALGCRDEDGNSLIADPKIAAIFLT
jgi:hypothetical protein